MPDLTPRAITVLETLAFDPARAVPLKGDLSSRRYFRVAGRDGTAILMVYPVEDAQELAKVIDMTTRLSEVGLSVPSIYASDPDGGIAVIEDFGDLHLADLLRNGDDALPLLQRVIDALEVVRTVDATGLPAPDAGAFVGWLDILDDWLPGISANAAKDLRDAMTEILPAILDAPRCLSLRDAHAENVIWLSERRGIGKVGLIDYQDAFAFHPLYDIASTLRDARIDIPEEIVTALLTRAAGQIGLDDEEARLAFDLLTVQRNLRIAAIFHRSAARDGKTAHLVHLPRVYGHIRRAADNPGLQRLAQPLRGVLEHRAETA